MQYNATAVSQALYSCVEFLQYRASKTRDIASHGTVRYYRHEQLDLIPALALATSRPAVLPQLTSGQGAAGWIDALLLRPMHACDSTVPN
jgi:hypothetical protein